MISNTTEVRMDEKPWFKSYDPGMPHTLRPYPESTLLEAVRETVKLRPEHTALIFKGRRMSYAELERLSNAFGSSPCRIGRPKGRSRRAVDPQFTAGNYRSARRLESRGDCLPDQFAVHCLRAGICPARGGGGNSRRPDAFLRESQGAAGAQRGQAHHRHQYQRSPRRRICACCSPC